MSVKSVAQIISPPPIRMVGDGFRVHNIIPGAVSGGMEAMDPFILLDYNAKWKLPPTDRPRGVGVHPHRGFETVTIAYRGAVAHHDSAGGGGKIQEGDVQWMTAGSGVLHKEYHEEEFTRRGGEFQMVQLWVNLPAADKMTPPRYQALRGVDLPRVELPEGGGVVEVIAGEYRGVAGAAHTFSPIHVMNVKLEAGGGADFDLPSDHNTALLVVDGSVRVNGEQDVPTDHFVRFRQDGEQFHLSTSETSLILVLSGRPLNEPIVAQGPFVMNTTQEIREAIEDLQAGKFGTLAD